MVTIARQDSGGAGHGRSDVAVTYRIKAAPWAANEIFWIYTGSGRKAYRVDGRLDSVSGRLSLTDAQGREEAFIAIDEMEYNKIGDKLRIDRIEGSGALLQKDLITIVRDQLILSFDNGDELEVYGNFSDHEYQFVRGRVTVAEVSRRWFTIVDSYGVQIQPGEDDVMIVAVALALDQSSSGVGSVGS